MIHSRDPVPNEQKLDSRRSLKIKLETQTSPVMFGAWVDVDIVVFMNDLVASTDLATRESSNFTHCRR